MSKLTNPVDLSRFVAAATVAYLAAVAFTDFGEEDQPPTGSDFSTDAILRASEEVAEFMLQCHREGLLVRYVEEHAGTPEQFGHDFWLTRNGHGAGFWSRGMGETGESISTLAGAYSEVYVYLHDDDHLVYFG